MLETRERLVLQHEFPQPFHRLGRPHSGQGRCYHWSALESQWLSVMPEDRDTLAAWLLPEVTACATSEARGNAQVLPRLAESGVLPLDPLRASILLAAANSTGGVMGKMIDAQSICVATAGTNQVGKEADIFKAVIWHSIFLASIVGLITALQAFVPPFTLMVPK